MIGVMSTGLIVFLKMVVCSWINLCITLCPTQCPCSRLRCALQWMSKQLRQVDNRQQLLRVKKKYMLRSVDTIYEMPVTVNGPI